MRPSVLHLGHKGAMLLARFMSIPKGFRFLREAHYVAPELEKWHQNLCEKYVQIVEERLNEALTTYEKTYDGAYVRRSHRRQPRKEVFVPIHLYGQLVQHKHGYQLLEQQDFLQSYFTTIRSCPLHTEKDTTKVKAALWAVGHIGTSVWGMGILQEQNIIPEIIKLAEESGVFSIRGTAYFVLGLIATTKQGSDRLMDYGWETLRHSHGEVWPVMEEVGVQDTSSPRHNISVCSSTSSLTISEPSSPHKSLPQYPRLASPEIPIPPPPPATQDLDESIITPGSSPKVAFFVGSDDGRSRSNTGASTGQLGSSFEGSLDIGSSSTDGQKIVIEISQPEEDLIDAANTQAALVSAAGDGNEVSGEDVKLRSFSMYESTYTKEEVQVRSSSDPPDVNKLADRKTDGAIVHFDVSDSEEEDKTVINFQGTSATKRTRNGIYNIGKVSEQLSVRDERSNSTESARTTPTTASTAASSKSRSDSLYTDTSSGFSSLDSSHYQVTTTTSEHAQLTPIPSASSLLTADHNQSQDREILTHPSDFYRKLANLKRMPSLNRRFSNPIMGHISPSNTLQRKSNSDSVGFTSAHDIQGYATLRELKRQRTIACDLESQANAKGVIDENMLSPYNVKSRSLDFRLGKFSGSPLRNPSATSLDEMDTGISMSSNLLDLGKKVPSTGNLRKLQGSGGRAEYAGICLPADIMMLFQVNEGEDSRSRRPKSSIKEFENLYPIKPRIKVVTAMDNPSTRRSLSMSEDIPADDELEYHSDTTCMACMRIQPSQETDVTEASDIDDYDESFLLARDNLGADSAPASGQPSPLGGTLQRAMQVKSRNSSLSDVITGSVTSTTSLESMSASKSMPTEETALGRSLLRKEVLRFIVNLSSSVGIKSAEQGLLTLKQKFPRVFHDLCLYCEVCCMLAQYSYRLTARRFIQELFLDVEYGMLYEEPREILKLEDCGQGPTESDLKLERVLESLA